MDRFLDRYLRGEHKAVWDELVTMGTAIQDASIYVDAQAVAYETMRRARHNVESLIPRLVAVGYQFGYGWIQPFVRERLLHPYHANYDPAQANSFARGVPLQPAIPDTFSVARRVSYIERLELAHDQPPLFAPATDDQEHIMWLEQEIVQHPGMAKNLRHKQETLRAKLTPRAVIGQVEAHLGTLPLSIRAWYEVVGGVNFVGDHPEWRTLLPESQSDFPNSEYDYLNPMHVLDPLVILPLDEKRLAVLTGDKPVPRASFLVLSDDEYGKYLDGARDYYEIMLPSLAADTQVVGLPHARELTFVAYLSECFRWAGFPGWSRFEQIPERDLLFLTQDLLPIY